ncbi:hypothetical protein DL768_005523 [Monosporascus sp. mg162]|nr:hypothetical protein DL768_005523 [Monosporascus sp. mg162]
MGVLSALQSVSSLRRAAQSCRSVPPAPSLRTYGRIDAQPGQHTTVHLWHTLALQINQERHVSPNLGPPALYVGRRSVRAARARRSGSPLQSSSERLRSFNLVMELRSQLVGAGARLVARVWGQNFVQRARSRPRPCPLALREGGADAPQHQRCVQRLDAVDDGVGGTDPRHHLGVGNRPDFVPGPRDLGAVAFWDQVVRFNFSLQFELVQGERSNVVRPSGIDVGLEGNLSIYDLQYLSLNVAAAIRLQLVVSSITDDGLHGLRRLASDTGACLQVVHVEGAVNSMGKTKDVTLQWLFIDAAVQGLALWGDGQTGASHSAMHFSRTLYPKRDNDTLLDGFSKTQEKQLKSRKKSDPNMTDEDKWREIYHILFPDDDLETIPSPYYDEITRGDHGSTSSPGHPEHFAAFARRELPRFVRRELGILFQEEFRDIGARDQYRIQDLVLRLQPRLIDLYEHSTRDVAETGEESSAQCMLSDARLAAEQSAIPRQTVEFGPTYFPQQTDYGLRCPNDNNNARSASWPGIFNTSSDAVLLDLNFDWNAQLDGMFSTPVPIQPYATQPQPGPVERI